MKISLELDDALNKRLKQFALDNYQNAHGKQQIIIRDALISYLDSHESARKSTKQTQEIKKNQTISYGMPLDGERPTKEPESAASKPKVKPKAKKQGAGEILKDDKLKT
jgi:hypothetical protein